VGGLDNEVIGVLSILLLEVGDLDNEVIGVLSILLLEVGDLDNEIIIWGNDLFKKKTPT
jgi:hypothetical protein